MEKLIFGKNELKRIVSIEPIDNALDIFFEDNNGNPYYKRIPNKYWLLTNYKPRPNSERLNGDLYYKHITKVDTISEFKDLKSRNYNSVFTVNDSKEASMIYQGMSYFKGMKVSEVSLLSFDIESLTLEHTDNAKVVLISNTYRNKNRTIKKLFDYKDYNTGVEFFDAWCEWVRDIDPSVILGHNINMYDLPYMNFCAQKAGTTLKLGRNDSDVEFSTYESKFRKDGSQSYPYHKVKIYGREIIDTFFLSIKYDVSRKYISYGLKSIIKQEGLERKDRQHYDAATIKDNYLNDKEWEKIKAYAKDDADDALALYDLMISPFFYMTQSVPRSFQAMIESASGGQIGSIMLRGYLQNNHSIPKADEVNEYQGAISFGVPGIYKNVMKIDFSGLYPSIMREYKVYDKYKDPLKYFLTLVEYFAQFRLKYKKLYKETGEKYYDDMQGALKIFANSTYGFLGTKGVNFNSPKNAAFITEKGRELLKYTIEWATGETYEYWKNKVDTEEEINEE